MGKRELRFSERSPPKNASNEWAQEEEPIKVGSIRPIRKKRIVSHEGGPPAVDASTVFGLEWGDIPNSEWLPFEKSRYKEGLLLVFTLFTHDFPRDLKTLKAQKTHFPFHERSEKSRYKGGLITRYYAFYARFPSGPKNA